MTYIKKNKYIKRIRKNLEEIIRDLKCLKKKLIHFQIEIIKLKKYSKLIIFVYNNKLT